MADLQANLWRRRLSSNRMKENLLPGFFMLYIHVKSEFAHLNTVGVQRTAKQYTVIYDASVELLFVLL